MKVKPVLSVNIDEVAADIESALPFLQRNQIDSVEIRTLRQKNFATFDDGERVKTLQEIRTNGLTVCALASPLFKWYRQQPDTVMNYDSFGFPAVLSENEKIQAMERVADIATMLDCRKVRIFSNLNGGKPDLEEVLTDRLFPMAVDLMCSRGIHPLVENEPVCHSFRLRDMLTLVEKFPGLGLWLDVANFYQVGEKIDIPELDKIIPYTHHVHLKDFVWEGDTMRHVPLGQGIIPWEKTIRHILSDSKHPISFSVETHVKENKIEATEESIRFFRSAVRRSNAIQP
jgi:sugar phosphate isomerase/epimerase